MKHAVVLGIGNRLMGDDGIGVRIAEALGQGNPYGNVRFAAGETDVDYCLNELAGADLCIIIDAVCSAGDLSAGTDSASGREPCSVEVTDLKEIFARKRTAAAFHDFDIFHAMKMEAIKKEGILITVEICSADLSGELSPPMRERFEEIVREARVIIVSYLLSMGFMIEAGSA